MHSATGWIIGPEKAPVVLLLFIGGIHDDRVIEDSHLFEGVEPLANLTVVLDQALP
jgi:hypothetical protein